LYSDERLFITYCHSGAVKLSVPREVFTDHFLFVIYPTVA
jgi:hypothetical protein